MKKSVKWVLLFAILALLFVPVFTVESVPSWSVRLIDEENNPVENANVDQVWKDFSLEFWRFEEHVNYENRSDSNGIVIFPARYIRISAMQFLAAKARDVIVTLNPHASFGPHSYILCADSLRCNGRYEPGSKFPVDIVVKN